MRKYIMLACMLAVDFAFAQFEDSKLLLRGNISGNNYENISSSSTSERSSTRSFISFAPAVGLAVKPDLVIGIEPNVGFGKNKNSNSSSTTKSKNVSAGLDIFLRKYKGLKDNLFLTLKGSGGFNWHEDKQEGEVDYYHRSVSISFVPGLAYKVSDKLMLEASVGSASFSIGKTSYTSYTITNKSLGASFSNLGFGFVMIF
ncbi:MAG: outer membrane beta-barrel protein [Cytophagales bacterium]|nr:outer membrane beta-barrel protein [Cytophagales bacterium]